MLFKKELDGLLLRNVSVYITTASLYAYDRESQFSGFIKQYYDGERVGTHLYEDWPKEEMELQVFPADLYRLRKK